MFLCAAPDARCERKFSEKMKEYDNFLSNWQKRGGRRGSNIKKINCMY